MSGDSPARIAIVHDSVDDAEHILSVLRNAGMAVRPHQITNPDELQGVLERQILDLVVIDAAHTEPDIVDTRDMIENMGKDLPIVAIAMQPDVNTISACLKDGAVDVAQRQIKDHVSFVIKREVSNLRDRRAMRDLKESLKETEKRCNALLDSSRDSIAYVHEGMHVYANQAYLERFDCDSFEDIEVMPLLDMFSSDSSATLKDVLKQLSKSDEPPEPVKVTGQKIAGGTFETIMEFSSASIDGEPCTQILLRDQAVDPEMAEELEQLKTTDLVTGLFNRGHFNEHLGTALAQARKQANVGQHLLFVSIDNYGQVITQVGMGGADLVLGTLGKLITDHLQAQDKAGRLSDQTLGMCIQADAENAKKRAEKLRAAVENQVFEAGGHSTNITISVGVVPISESVDSTDDLTKLAQQEAKKAEDKGGNQICVFDPIAKEKEAGSKAHWVHLIKDAIGNNRLMLLFQPIVSLHGAEGNNYEVLVRMQGREGDEISPAHFLPVAEEHGLMPKIDRWVVRHAIENIKERQGNGENLRLFVKITPDTIADPTMVKWVADQLKKYGVSGERIIFEMRESVVVTNIKPVRAFQKGIAQLHCGFCLEQFGSGINSFQMLKHIPAEFLKVDRSFMKDLPSNEESQNKIRELTNQAHSMGKVTIAEFVEDAASMSVLWQCGVNFVQGNFLQEPEKVMEYDFSG